MDINFKRTNGPLDDLIDEILSMADVHHSRIIREMVISALKTGQENDYLAGPWRVPCPQLSCLRECQKFT